MIAIIGVLLGLLLPNLAALQTTAKASAALSHVQAFGKGFMDHATFDQEGRFSSGAFDHYRDGDIRSHGWVSDLLNAKYANPGKSLDPATAFNEFADPSGRTRPAKVGDPLVEGMTDGPTAPIATGRNEGS